MGSQDKYEVYNLVEKSNVVIFVLDIRDPQSYRQPKVEELAKQLDKKIIFLLNKADLVPKNVCLEWLEYFRAFYPTLIVKTRLANYGRFNFFNVGNTQDIPEYILKSSSHLIGVTNLYDILSNYSRCDDSRQNIVVCVVGYPNVGKSSLINSLLLLKSHRNVKGHKRLNTISAEFGSTKKTHCNQIDKYIQVYDTPGIIYNDTGNRITIYNEISKGGISDPIDTFSRLFRHIQNNEYVSRVLNRQASSSSGQSQDVDMEPQGVDHCMIFLSNFAIMRGKLRIGSPDLNAAAICFFESLSKGHLQYFALPNVDGLHLVEFKKAQREVHEKEFKYTREKPPESKLGILNKKRKKEAKKMRKLMDSLIH